MDIVVLTKAAARGEYPIKVILRPVSGKPLFHELTVPPGADVLHVPYDDLRKLSAKRRTPSDVWPPDGVDLRCRVRNWALRHSLVGAVAAAGAMAYAWPYAVLLIMFWAVAATGIWYTDRHGVDRLDPACARPFRTLLLASLASSAKLYFVPVSAVVAGYLCAAVVDFFFGGFLTRDEVLLAQRAFATVDDWFDTYVKMQEWQVLLLLAGVYLLTHLLVAWNEAPTTPRPFQGRLLPPARVLNRVAAAHGRFAGPAAATLAALASFTFLSQTVAVAGNRLRLTTESDTKNYQNAYERVEEELTTQVTQDLYTRIVAEMPLDYQESLHANTGTVITKIRDWEHHQGRPLLPEQEQRVGAAEEKLKNVTVTPAAADTPPPPGDVTHAEVEAARDWASRAPDVDAKVELLDDSGKSAFLQTEKVAADSAWKLAKDTVAKHFPLGAPIVDALGDAYSAVVQEKIRAAIPPIINLIERRLPGVTDAIRKAGEAIVNAVDVKAVARAHAGEANASVRRASAERAALEEVHNTQRQTLTREYVEHLLSRDIPTVEKAANRLIDSRDGDLKRTVVQELSGLLHQGGENRGYAARTLKGLYPHLPELIDAADFKLAVKYCICRR